MFAMVPSRQRGRDQSCTKTQMPSARTVLIKIASTWEGLLARINYKGRGGPLNFDALFFASSILTRGPCVERASHPRVRRYFPLLQKKENNLYDQGSEIPELQ